MKQIDKDRNTLKRLVESYGKADVVKFVKNLNEAASSRGYFLADVEEKMKAVIKNKSLDAWFFNDFDKYNPDCRENDEINSQVNNLLPGDWKMFALYGNGTEYGEGFFYETTNKLILVLACYDEESLDAAIDDYSIYLVEEAPYKFSREDMDFINLCSKSAGIEGDAIDLKEKAKKQYSDAIKWLIKEVERVLDTTILYTPSGSYNRRFVVDARRNTPERIIADSCCAHIASLCRSMDLLPQGSDKWADPAYVDKKIEHEKEAIYGYFERYEEMKNQQ